MSFWRALGESACVMLTLLIFAAALAILVLGGNYILYQFGVIPYVVANALLVWLLGAYIFWRSR